MLHVPTLRNFKIKTILTLLFVLFYALLKGGLSVVLGKDEGEGKR
jgi:hypothetical protein